MHQKNWESDSKMHHVRFKLIINMALFICMLMLDYYKPIDIEAQLETIGRKKEKENRSLGDTRE